jgi:membrane protein DedA with SNARE-associated domain
MSLEDLISNYGYLAILVGTFLEGETVLVLGGFAAHRGYLELPWVIASAFLGTLLGDQFFFYLGRLKGQGFLLKRPTWQARSERLFALLGRHEVWVIIGFRFLYGLRSVTPFAIGACRYSPFRFLILNILGAAIWAITVGVLGYLFGYAIEEMIGNIKHYELWFFLSVAVLWLIIRVVGVLIKKQARKHAG